MMKNKLKQYINTLTNISLADDVRSDMRTALSEHIDTHQPTRSPWVPILSPLQAVGRSAMVAAVVLIALGGISMAAETSLPGDPLYSIKVNVNEGFMALTANSPTSEAALESRIATRRIAELETLAARGDLSQKLSQDLTSAISKHTKLAREHIARISLQGGAGDAASLEAELLSTLETHSDIMADLALSNEGNRATTTASAAKQLSQLAQNKAADDVSTTVSISSEAKLKQTSKADELSPRQVKRLLERTAERLEEARGKFNEKEEFGNAAVRDGVEALLIASAEIIDRAIDYIDEDKHISADPLLRQALMYAHEAAILMDTRRSLEISSGIAIDKLLDNNATSSATTTLELMLGKETATGTSEVSTDDINTEATSSTGTEVNDSTNPSSIMSTDIETTTSTDASSSTTSQEPSDDQNFTRRHSSSSSDTNQRIDKILERVKDTLDTNSPRGMLPSRTSDDDSE